MEYRDGEGSAAERGVSAEQHSWNSKPALSSLSVPPLPWLQLLSDVFHHWPRRSILVAGAVAIVFLTVWFRSPFRDVPEPPPPPSTSLADLIRAPSSSQAFARVADPPAVSPRPSPAEPFSREYKSIDAAVDEALVGGEVEEDAQDTTQTTIKPSVIRTATLRIVVKSFDSVRAAVERLATAGSGFIEAMTISEEVSNARSLHATLRIPADRLGEAMAPLRELGQVVEDTQGSEDVSEQAVDLDVRLSSARTAEGRLIELLRNRTGKLTDVLAVERELSRVRVTIERLTATKTNLSRRVAYATLQIQITEERKPQLAPGPLTFKSRVRVAVLDGMANAIMSVESILEAALRIGPLYVLWTLVLGPGLWLVLRRMRDRQARHQT
jgi:hypothetical protein